MIANERNGAYEGTRSLPKYTIKFAECPERSGMYRMSYDWSRRAIKNHEQNRRAGTEGLIKFAKHLIEGWEV